MQNIFSWINTSSVSLSFIWAIYTTWKFVILMTKKENMRTYFHPTNDITDIDLTFSSAKCNYSALCGLERFNLFPSLSFFQGVMKVTFLQMLLNIWWIIDPLVSPIPFLAESMHTLPSMWAMSTAKLVRCVQEQLVCVWLVARRRQSCVDQNPIMVRLE